MKKIALFLMMVYLTLFVCASGSNALAEEESCTRENLTKITDQYFEVIQAHKTSDLPLASTVKLTENGIRKEVGKGFWETAGKPLLRRTLVDNKKCTTATISVIEEPFNSKTVGTGGIMIGGPGMSGGGSPAPAKVPAGAPGNGDAVPSGSVSSDMFGGAKELPK